MQSSYGIKCIMVGCLQTRNKFDLQGEPDVVNNVLKIKCADVARSYRYKLHSKYQNLVDEHNSEYTRNHPPSFISPETWGNQIDYWTNPKSIAMSTTNKANRSMSKTNHSCGSKSFPIRATEKMDKIDGSLGSFAEFYKETHYNAKREKWATPECESLHVEMAKDEEAQNLQTDAVPLTAEEMSIKHLCARSGVVKGIGMRPSSSLRTTGALLQGHNDEVHLLMERTQKMEEQRQLERQQRLQLEQKFNALMDFVKFGQQGPHPPSDNGSAGCRLSVS